MTVPSSFRKTLPNGTVLHKAALEPTDVQEWTGFRVTSPQRTLLDVAAERTISEEQLDRAAKDALDRGLVRRSWLLAAPQHFFRNAVRNS